MIASFAVIGFLFGYLQQLVAMAADVRRLLRVGASPSRETVARSAGRGRYCPRLASVLNTRTESAPFTT
ncbi:MAG: hypothetical protein HOQ11_06615 [Gemmatimonadaceae bacterium]|nr:hypothetical protein [Gemmatimonadaceae bacterium]NUQ93031.1 hypothetical protein [Gemmatimonadaceae bacterium]NUS97061.1 hypothetical protein [Gemmatimonadaceae bacterium]